MKHKSAVCKQVTFDSFELQEVTDYIRLSMYNTSNPFAKQAVAPDSSSQIFAKLRVTKLKKQVAGRTQSVLQNRVPKANASVPRSKLRMWPLLSRVSSSHTPKHTLRFQTFQDQGHPLLKLADVLLEVSRLFPTCQQ